MILTSQINVNIEAYAVCDTTLNPPAELSYLWIIVGFKDLHIFTKTLPVVSKQFAIKAQEHPLSEEKDMDCL